MIHLNLFCPSAVSVSQTALQAEPAGPHLRHLQQGVQEQLQPAAPPVGAHGHQDEGPRRPGEGGRREGRTGGEAVRPSLPPPPQPALTASSSPSPNRRPRGPPPARSARQPRQPTGLCVHRPGNPNHGCTASTHPGSCCRRGLHGAGGFAGRGARKCDVFAGSSVKLGSVFSFGARSRLFYHRSRILQK